MTKPLRTIVEQSGFSDGVQQIKGIKPQPEAEASYSVGDTVKLTDVLHVGDVVKVQGKSKGRGFAGAIKRHGFAGGPKTHGQSDRERAVGSIGAGTTPGKVLKGKKMPGHYGDETATIRGLVVLHINDQDNEVWLSGPVPGHSAAMVRIIRQGETKDVELDATASNLPQPEEEATAPEAKEEADKATEKDQE
jgi:50S ribosomal protein uL3